ncbi:hypothetical protein HNQ88_003920 [Aureibacter tunicatorum]|uniref:Uncharacterized protein n=2 Tax=Aureibacter tunicatorum TaxID=866807 RepID=A0AAE3XSN3_9BACT|nr:hypothetical protein [Aureibacter tunicatorum]
MKENRKFGCKVVVCSVMLLISMPLFLYANAGTPMILFSLFHLFFLNLIIGLIESHILERNGIENKAGLIILANYFSMFAGMYFIAPYFAQKAGDYDFWGMMSSSYQMSGFFRGIIASIIITLFLEYPFAYYALVNKKDSEKLLNPFLIANLSTNIVMFVVYYGFASMQASI